MLKNIPENINKAYQEALKAQEKSYCHYSHFPVGSAIKFTNSDELSVGCNVENISYGGTICAERSAVVSHISRHGKGVIEFAVVVADTESPTLPCALCLQVLAEFTTEDFPIYLGNKKSLLKKYTFRELLPHNFNTLFDRHEKS